MRAKQLLLLTVLGLLCLGMAFATYQVAPPAAPATTRLSRYFPPGALLYLQAKDFSALLNNWNASQQKSTWLASDDYEMFSRSRLFLRLRDASDQFSAAAGLPLDMKFTEQMAGTQSALALYDIGNLQFLYITRRAEATSMESGLWQTRSRLETRSAGGVTFYVRSEPQTSKVVAFALSGDYLLLATREDLIANALQLMQGSQNPSMETEPWWLDSVAGAGTEGDLRMVLNLEKIVPSPYFRSYWVQQNISEMKQYRTAVSDLFRSDQGFREERVLLRNPVAGGTPAADSDAVSDLARLVPPDAGFYEVQVSPSSDDAYGVLENEILARHAGSGVVTQDAPRIQLTSGETGSPSDLETRIDEAPAQVAPLTANEAATSLKGLLAKAPVRAMLRVHSSEMDEGGVFVRMHSAIAFRGDSNWSETEVRTTLVNVIGAGLTAGGLGLSWQTRAGYEKLDGLWALAVAVQGRYLLISDDEALLNAMLGGLNQPVTSEPAAFVAGFNHGRERRNLSRLAEELDQPDASTSNLRGSERAPQFFSGNVASLSETMARISAETIVIHDDGRRVTQTVSYTLSGQ